MRPKVEKRSPLKDKPLRYAGQSLDDQIIALGDDMLPWILYPTFLIIYITMKWFEQAFPPSKSSFLIPSYISNALFLAFIGYCIIQNEPIQLIETDVYSVTFHLSRYIRTFEPKRK